MTIPTDDRGLLLGDGLFETLLWQDGRLHDFAAHAARMRDGCAVLGLPAPDVEALEAVALEAVAGGSGRLAVRLTWSAGSGGRGLDRPEAPQPRLVARAEPAPRPETPAVLVTVGVPRNDRSPASRIKSLSYLDQVLARREARAMGADEAVQLNLSGAVAGCAAANLFWISGDRLFTPALDCGVLAGVMRARVVAAAGKLSVEVVEGAFTPSELAAADAVFATNSLIGVRPADRLDGRVMRAEHPLITRLAQAET